MTMDYQLKKKIEDKYLIESNSTSLAELTYRLNELNKVKNNLPNLDEFMKEQEIKQMSGHERLRNLMSEASIVTKDAENTFYKVNGKNSKYATLEACNSVIKPLLKKYELLLQNIISQNTLVTSIYHNNEEIVTSTIQLIAADNMQKLGSAITYARRYNLCLLFNLDVEDDDGNQSVGNKVLSNETKADNKGFF